MTNQSNSTVDVVPDFDIQLDRLWNDLWAWLTGHSLQIAIGIGVAAVLVLILYGAKAIGVRICASDPDHTHWRTTLGKVLAKTKFWFMAAVAARLVSEFAQAPEGVAKTFNFLFVVAATLQVAIWVRELILGIIEHRAGGTENSGLGNAMRIVQILTSVAIFGIAIIVILDNLGVNVTGLIAGFGIGGIAIGLAAQGIFSDLFAALSILFDKPFRRGDGIRWDTTNGTVEQIGLKSTRVRSLDGQEVVISNANLLNKEVHNFALLEHRRLHQLIGVTYQTPVEQLRAIPDMIRGIVEAHESCKVVRCALVNFGASSLDFELVFDVHSTDYEYTFATKGEIIIEILDAFNKAGIEFAYPTQTTFTAAPDGTLVMPYPHVKMVATEDLDPPHQPDGDGSR